MRSVRPLLVLVAILAALGGYIYFVESKKPKTEGPEGAEQGPKVFDVKSTDITELELKAVGGEQTTLKKVDGHWQITAPVSAPADEAEVAGVLSSLANLDTVRTVEEQATDLAQFGLGDTPRMEVGFKTAKDKDFRKLLLGDKSPATGDLYARQPENKKVVLVSGSAEGSFNKKPFDLRDKKILAFDRDKVDRIVIDAAGKPTEVVRADGEWKVTQPIQVPADFGTVEGLIGRLQSVQMKSIVAPEGSDPKEYGLDKPAATATLVSGSSQVKLLLGKAADASSVYAKDEARPMVFTVETSLLDELRKPADQLRQKDLFAFRSYNATSVTITRGTETKVFEKTRTDGKPPTEKWRQVKPAAKDMDAAQFDTFLAKLSSVRAESFLEAGSKTKTGLDTPVMTVVVKFDEGKKEEKVTFGKDGNDVYASAAGQPGALKISSTEFDDIIKALDALK